MGEIVPMPDAAPLIEVRQLRKEFQTATGTRVAVAGVSFDIRPGETFGLAGLSAAGKSTIGRIILGLIQPSSGEVLYEGRVISILGHKQRLPYAAKMQMVFQNPQASMNPRRMAASILEVPLRNFGIGNARERRERIFELLSIVGLSPRHAQQYPHELSGGQCQRLGIARALASEPKFIFLDEPVSALDVSIQAQILNLLKDLQERLGLTYLFVANNLNVARFICNRLAIIDGGRIVEAGDTEQIFADPEHGITRRLLSSIVSLDKDRAIRNDVKAVGR